MTSRRRTSSHRRPRQPRLVKNPAWATNTLVDAWEYLRSQVKPAWMPELENLQSLSMNMVSASVEELGCGQYGCAFKTYDARVVMKMTTDTTEANFAAKLSGELVRPICVQYHMVIALHAYHEERQIFLLWREAADNVGRIATVLGPRAMDIVNVQHAAAQAAYLKIHGGAHWRDIRSAISAWVETCEVMATQREVPALRELGAGLVEIWSRQQIFFGDIHDGNLGTVVRSDGVHWVVTDPGHTRHIDVEA